MRGLRIFTKLFFSHAGIGLVTLVFLSAILDVLMEQSLIQRTMDQLTAINILKLHTVKSYLLKSEEGLEALNAGGSFRRYFRSLVDEDRVIHDRSKDLEDILRVSNKFCPHPGWSNCEYLYSPQNQFKWRLTNSDSMAKLR
jgi:hypothetical protein